MNRFRTGQRPGSVRRRCRRKDGRLHRETRCPSNKNVYHTSPQRLDSKTHHASHADVAAGTYFTKDCFLYDNGLYGRLLHGPAAVARIPLQSQRTDANPATNPAIYLAIFRCCTHTTRVWPPRYTEPTANCRVTHGHALPRYQRCDLR